jgi:hypothetical protein
VGQYRGKVIVAGLIALVLAAAWFYGGNYAGAGRGLPPAAAAGGEANGGAAGAGGDGVLSGEPAEAMPAAGAETGDGVYTCTMSVRCDTILDNLALLEREKWELVPADGVIFPETTVTFYEGESAFNVLRREMKQAGIHLEFMNVPIYNSAYIEGINNLYEFDVGELSGWMYSVNGWFPNYGCSRYGLKDGDNVEFVYSCDLGHDVGGGYAAGGQWQPPETTAGGETTARGENTAGAETATEAGAAAAVAAP